MRRNDNYSRINEDDMELSRVQSNFGQSEIQDDSDDEQQADPVINFNKLLAEYKELNENEFAYTIQ